MGMPLWITPAGNLGVIADGVYFTYTFTAQDTGGSPLIYSVVAGSLPIGLTLSTTGLLYGSPDKNVAVNETQSEFNQDQYSKFVIRASNQLGIVADRTFEITVTGESPPTLLTPSGNLGNYYSGAYIGVQLQATDAIPDAILTYSIYSGNLPPGLSLSSTGLISGHVQSATIPAGSIPNYDESPYDSVPFDFVNINQDINYAFIIQVSDGISYALGSYSFYILSRESLTTDNTDITADAYPEPSVDSTNLTSPYVTTPSGNIGIVNSSDYFTYQFHGYDPDSDTINFATGTPLLVNDTHITCDTTHYTCDEISLDAISESLDLTLDPVTGWLYGTVPTLPISTDTYSFTISVYKSEFPSYVSVPVTFTIIVNGEFADEITWITPTNLGTIDNGSVSTLNVQAVSADGVDLFYQIAPDTASELPQGLTLFQDGLIAGRVSFKFFEFDGGKTTFDEQTTTFESVYTFTIQAVNNKKNVSSSQTFSLTVDPINQSPYQNLYLISYVDENSRIELDSLLNSPTVFPPAMVYRNNDSYFGIAPNLNMLVMSGVNPASAASYVAAMQRNHYNKTMYFGDLKTAIAVNPDGSILYEVVYVEMKDPQINSLGQSVASSLPEGDFPDLVTGTVYPNSILNMRNQIAYGPMNLYEFVPQTADNAIFKSDDTIDTADQAPISSSNNIGIANFSTHPLWMTSIQPDGSIPGYTEAFVICYCNPGTSARILYNINNYGMDFKLFEFSADRYVWDNALSTYFNSDEQSFDTGTQTTFDDNDCTFDKNSTRFFTNVDNYQTLFEGDGYLKFPKYNIVE